MTIEKFSKKAKSELERRRLVREAMFKHSGFKLQKKGGDKNVEEK